MTDRPWPHHFDCDSQAVVHMCGKCLDLVYGTRLPRIYTADEVTRARDALAAQQGSRTNEHRRLA